MNFRLINVGSDSPVLMASAPNISGSFHSWRQTCGCCFHPNKNPNKKRIHISLNQSRRHERQWWTKPSQTKLQAPPNLKNKTQKIRPVTGGAQWGKSPYKSFLTPWKNVLDIVQKYWSLFHKFGPLSENFLPHLVSQTGGACYKSLAFSSNFNVKPPARL